MTTLQKDFVILTREVRFERLVDAWRASKRHKLWISTALFGERLQSMGAYLDFEGNWRLFDGKKEKI